MHSSTLPFITLMCISTNGISQVSLRALMAMDVLGLSDLENATQGMLRELFGDLKADELSRQFVYYCKMMPAV